jgi:hypothetical protein
VYKVNPREQLHNKSEWFDVEVEEIYQEDELSNKFNIDIEVLPELLVGEREDVVITTEKENKVKEENIESKETIGS